MNRRNYRGENNPMFGKHHILETRLKISNTKSGVLTRSYDKKFKELFNKIKHNEIINGILLSDGYVTNSKKGHSMIVLEQSKDHEELCFAFKEEMERLGFRCSLLNRSRFRSKNDTKLLHSIIVTTEANYCFSLFRQRWYQNNNKIVPSNIKLTDKTLAYWFMGDGSSYKFKSKKGFVVVDFATCCFRGTGNNSLIKKLRKLGIKKARKDSNNTIRISTKKEVIIFMNMVKPHILSGFEYKIKLPGG